MKHDNQTSSRCLHPICSVLDRLHAHRAQMAPHQKDRTGGRLILDSLDEIERLTTAYNELIMEVVCKYEGETRHETARRYIREREEQRGGPETQNTGSPLHLA